MLKEKDVAITIREQELLVVEERLAGRQQVHPSHLSLHIRRFLILLSKLLIIQSVMDFGNQFQGPDSKMDWAFLIGTLLTGFWAA